MARKPTTTVVLRMHPRPDWVSMREILPSIEAAWKATRSREHRVRFVRLDRPSELLRHFSALAAADRWVMTSFDSRLSFEKLSATFGLLKPVVVHLHGEFTFGGPWFAELERKLGPALTYVAASQADARSVRLCVRRPKIAVVPFPLAKSGARNRPQAAPSRDWIYVGRISEQKELHTLLVALWILKRQGKLGRRVLKIYGRPDRLGSPNFGIPGGDYAGILRRLVRELGLQAHVRWMGYVSPARLRAALARDRSTFVSPSLHSDENFGVAAFRHLERGLPCVLSLWGGHRDLAARFGSGVRGVPVHETRSGPVISPLELARVLMATGKGSRVSPDSKLAPYTVDASAKALRALLSSRGKASSARTAVGKEILRRSKRFWKPERFRAQRVFLGYDDALAVPFFRAYGMGSRLPIPKRLLIMPWVRIESGRIVARDPRRGRFEWKRRAGTTIRVLTTEGEATLSAADARMLAAYGLAFDASALSQKRKLT